MLHLRAKITVKEWALNQSLQLWVPIEVLFISDGSIGMLDSSVLSHRYNGHAKIYPERVEINEAYKSQKHNQVAAFLPQRPRLSNNLPVFIFEFKSHPGTFC